MKTRRILLFVLLVFFSGFVIAQDDGTWTTGTPMPTPRSELASALLDGKIYVAGGLASNPDGAGWIALDDFEAYDIETDTWEVLEPLPAGLHHLGMAAANGRVFVSGGYDGANFTNDVTVLWAYDPESGEWSQVTDMPAPRAAHAMVAIENKLYIIGGVGDSIQLWIYGIEADEWDTDNAEMPTPREHLSAVTLDGKLYVIGGRWGRNLGTLEVYDPETDEWTTLTEMPTPHGGLTAAAVNGNIHVTGGEDLNTSKTYDAHEVYDPETGEWMTFAEMPTARHGVTSQGSDGLWYVIGGGEEAGGGTFTSLTGVVEIFEQE